MKQAKINLEQANQLLSLLKVEAVVVEGNDENPADNDVDVQKLIKSIPEADEDFIREKLRAEIEEDVKSKNTGKWINSLRSKVAQTFGMKTSELSNLQLEEILALAKDSTRGNVDKAQKDWLSDREKLIAEQEAEMERLRGQYEAQLRDSEHKYLRRDMRDRFISLLNNMPRNGGDLNAQAEALLAAAERNYTTKYDAEKGRVGLFTKGDEPSPVFRGKKIFSDEDFAQEFAESMAWIRKDNRNVPPVAPKSEQQVGGGIQFNSNRHIPDNIPDRVKQTLLRLQKEQEEAE